ncbi:MAG TPA: phosphoribosyltransferase family protein [Bacteroidia bacterium]|nr:phosphoribosyltransferase family protein [Bacteroidia bacterium]
MSSERTLVMNAGQIERRINRLAWQVYEHCFNEKEIIIAGIEPNGLTLSERIAAVLRSISPLKVTVAALKVDKENPLEKSASVSLPEKDFSGKTIIVVDDVSNSGRTLMYGVDFFLRFKIKSILTVVLVDRDHNRFPVKTNFVGLSLSTTMQEHITVEFGKNGSDKVFLD